MKLVEGPGAIALHPDAAAKPEIAALRLKIAAAYGAERFIAHQHASKVRPDRTSLLAQASIPMLFVAAEDDKVIAAEQVRRMAEAVPRARLSVVPRGGHLVPIEQPGAVAALLADWIASSNETEQKLSGRAS